MYSVDCDYSYPVVGVHDDDKLEHLPAPVRGQRFPGTAGRAVRVASRRFGLQANGRKSQPLSLCFFVSTHVKATCMCTILSPTSEHARLRRRRHFKQPPQEPITRCQHVKNYDDVGWAGPGGARAQVYVLRSPLPRMARDTTQHPCFLEKE